MEVILLERIEKLGQMGDLVRVKDGFARNYLLPQHKALRATAANRERFEAERSQLEADNLTRRTEAEAVAEKMEGLTVIMVRQAGDTGQLYGSVNARDIAQGVTDAGYTLERRQVAMDRVIKTLGLHPIKVVLHPEVTLTVTANVARSEEEAKLQAEGIDVTATDRDDDEQLEAEDVAELFEEEAQPVLTEDEADETAPSDEAQQSEEEDSEKS